MRPVESQVIEMTLLFLENTVVMYKTSDNEHEIKDGLKCDVCTVLSLWIDVNPKVYNERWRTEYANAIPD